MQQPFDCPSDEVVYYRDSESTFDQLDLFLMTSTESIGWAQISLRHKSEDLIYMI